MSIFDTIRQAFGGGITSLDLKRDAQTFDTSKIGMPKPPPLDISLDSLLKYSRKSELVYACIEKKAQAAVDAELVVEKKAKSGEWERVDFHPLTALLNKPNPWDNGESFIKSWIVSENFADNFYCEVVRSGAGIPAALYPLNPVYLVPQWIMTSKGWKIDFYYYFQNGYPVRLEVDDVMVRRRHSMGSIYSDVSPVMIALASVDADTAMVEYVRAFFNNGGMPSGALTVKDQRLTDEQAAAMQQRWIQKYGRGGTNRGGVVILDQSAEFQTISAKLNELNNESLSDEAATKICMAFGVPPIIIGALVGLKHVTQNATAKAAMSEFWAHTMSPELKSIRKYLTWNLLPFFEPIEAIKKEEIRVNWDMSQVVALQEDVDAVHKRVSDGYQKGVYTLNEARSKVGLDEVGSDVGGDEFFKAPAPSLNIGGDNGKPPPKGFNLNVRPEGYDFPSAGARVQKDDPLDDDTLLEKKTSNLKD